jgi:hypothetical protein
MLCFGASMQIQNNGLDAQGVKLVGPTDPEFGKHFPSGFDRLQPYSVLFANNSTRRIAAVTIVYDFNGEPGTGGRQTIESRVADPTVMLQPGDVRVFAPVFNFAQAVNANTLKLPLSGQQQKEIDYYMMPFEQAKTVLAKIDSVVWEDGTIAGPDTSHMLDVMNAEAKADSELMAIARSTTGTALTQQLANVPMQKAAASADEEDWYARRKHDLAQSWISAINQFGESRWRALLLDTRPVLQVRRTQ